MSASAAMPLPESYLALRRGLLLRLAISTALFIGIVVGGWSLAPNGGGSGSPAPPPLASANGGARVPQSAAPTEAAPPASSTAGSIADAMRPVTDPESLQGKSLEVLMQRPADVMEPADAAPRSASDEPQKASSSVPKLPKGPHLQAGIFASPANAEEMRKKLEAEGYPTYLETRVHVGPFQSRKDADKAREKLKEQGTATLFIAQ